MNYQLIRSRRKTLSLQIDAQGGLIVRAPMRLSVQTIEQFIAEKQNWINKKQIELDNQKIAKASYQAGYLFLFGGETYPLKLIVTGEPLSFKQQFFYLNTQYEPAQAFHWFYKKEFIKIALPRLEYYAQKHDLAFNQVRFKAQKTRWGSCSSKNNINLNYLLMMAPMWVIASVIAHELAHVKHKNHGEDFYQLLKNMMPDYQQADAWLKANSPKLHRL